MKSSKSRLPATVCPPHSYVSEASLFSLCHSAVTVLAYSPVLDAKQKVNVHNKRQTHFQPKDRVLNYRAALAEVEQELPHIHGALEKKRAGSRDKQTKRNPIRRPSHPDTHHL